jgi:hypothetical protein
MIFEGDILERDMKKQSFEDTLSRYAREAKFVIAKEDLPEDVDILNRLDVYLLQTPNRKDEVKEIYTFVKERVKKFRTRTSIILVKCDCCDPVLEACRWGLPVMNMGELFLSLYGGSFCEYDKDKDRYVFSGRYVLPKFPAKLSIRDDFAQFINWSNYRFKFWGDKIGPFVENLQASDLRQPRLF